MNLIKVTTITKKQAKAYAVLAMETIENSANDLDKKLLWDEIEVVMKLYTPQKAVQMANEIINKKGGEVKWMKR